ncbi:MAG: hypothetical protein KJZ72_04365 [Anaerolineales bacterium]|nr:hypothetical protein [Anaerolineales bacterium]
MTLKFKRNLPLLLLLVGLLAFLAVALGDRQIVSYTVNTAALTSASLTTQVSALIAQP